MVMNVICCARASLHHILRTSIAIMIRMSSYCSRRLSRFRSEKFSSWSDGWQMYSEAVVKNWRHSAGSNLAIKAWETDEMVLRMA